MHANITDAFRMTCVSYTPVNSFISDHHQCRTCHIITSVTLPSGRQYIPLPAMLHIKKIRMAVTVHNLHTHHIITSVRPLSHWGVFHAVQRKK